MEENKMHEITSLKVLRLLKECYNFKSLEIVKESWINSPVELTDQILKDYLFDEKVGFDKLSDKEKEEFKRLLPVFLRGEDNFSLTLEEQVRTNDLQEIADKLLNDKITSLRIYVNRYGLEKNPCYDAIPNFLKTNKSITRLNLTGNCRYKNICEALKKNEILKNLLIEEQCGFNFLFDALAENNTLQKLGILGHTLVFNRENSRDAESFSNLLKRNNSLRDIDLNGREIGNLKNPEIGKQNIELIAEGLEVNKTLTSLNLGYNNINDEGAKFLFEALKINRTLTSLDLSGNEISEEIMQKIEEKLKINKINIVRRNNFYNEAERNIPRRSSDKIPNPTAKKIDCIR